MGQDTAKGRRTDQNLNGSVVRDGEQVGIQARANERLVDIVKKGRARRSTEPNTKT
jgi:ketopantoate reductase